MYVRVCVFLCFSYTGRFCWRKSSWVPGSLSAVTADSYTITHCIMVIHAKTDSAMDQLDSEKLSHESGLAHADILWACTQSGY